MNAFVHINHESMEVYASFASDMWGKGVVEEVHKHGLASADIPEEVETFR